MSYQQLKKRTEGFTIIEVLIVLAIAGLILLIVFLAVPALQRNSRNTQRTNDAALITGAINDCLPNKNGNADSCDTFAELTTAGTFDSTKIKQLTAQVAGAGVLASGSLPAESVQIGRTFKCGSDGVATAAGASNRQMVVTYEVETTSGAVVRCLDV